MKRLWKDRSGTFAMLSALVIPVVVFSVGIGIDYGLAMDAHQRLKQAADAAVLSAVDEAQEAYIKNENVDLEDLIETSAQGFFAANVGEMASTTIGSVSVTPSVIKNEIKAELRYSASYDTSLMKVFGHSKISISNVSRAVVNVRSYININFLIDVSASMGIGATDADQQLVAAATGCAFACHINSTPGNSPYDKARAKGANMRIDVVRNAALTAVGLSKKAVQYDNQVTFGVYTFSNDLATVVPYTDSRASNHDYIQSSITSGVQMAVTNGGTNIENAIRSLAKELPDSGAGVRPDDRIQYVIVLTDGVESGQSWTAAKGWKKHPSTKENAPYKAYATHEVNYAVNDTACDELKSKEIGAYFIYTEYLEPLYGGFGDHDKARFGFVTSQLFPLIPTRFSACTGDNKKVIKASTPDDINRTVSEIVEQLSAPLRLF